jgi:polar amino acid transport system permease protein
MSYAISWDVVRSSLPLLAGGMVDTLKFAAISVTAGLVIGIAGAAARVSRVAGLRSATAVYVEAIRNTPMLVQLYFVFYGLPRLGIRLDSNATALAALSLYCGAYVLEILRANIEAVGRGQVEAARALGLSEAAVFGSVVLPQAMRSSLPALGGQVIVMIKISSLASVIGAVELTYRVVDIVAENYRSFELYAMAGLAYLSMTLATAALFRFLESRLRIPR